ncbi:MAG TPA: uroporphyrinogen-III C-methyltransferase [Bacteroidales bacterium]|nr:uroporphyrinogen-III C-methyltransferase [Bacteroidales bacterium]HPO64627.1 uroporphyrinogen-III C-methyltransferase [Bacteroidales bacterium]
MKIRVVARNSRLSLAQAQEVMAKIKGVDWKLIPLASYGDKHLEIPLTENTMPDFFTKELDEAILNDEADIAIHSAKDVPYPLPQGLELVALTECLANADVLVSRRKEKLSQLKPGAKIACSSPSRQEQIRQLRPDLEIVDIRGTIDQRLARVFNGEIDALVVAECALKRLELEEFIAETLPIKTHPLQGHLAVVARVGNAQMKSLFYPLDIRKNYGKVYLVGFGPGNPDLLTLRALQAIDEADIIFYDDLLDASFLLNVEAELVYVGKRRDKHAFEQDEINEMIYRAAIAGKQVVRLKGGDPMIFGRGGEEYDFLASKFVQVEIIPGITSALAAAATQAIPLTRRELARSVSFCTAHDPNHLPIPNTDTIVYYMGAHNAPIIAQKLIESGKKTDTTVIIVESAGSENERSINTTLQNLASGSLTVNSPALIIVGEHINPTNNATPSKQNKILVTSSSTKPYEHLGKVIHKPLIQIKEVDPNEQLLQIIHKADQYNWLIFTSRWSVVHFLSLLNKVKKDIRIFAKAQIIAIGKNTASVLEKYHLHADWIASDESSSGIIDLFMNHSLVGKNVFIPHSNLSPNTMPNLLRKMGYQVDTLVVYENVLPENVQPVDLSEIDIIAFGSPSGVKNFKKIYKSIPAHIQVIAKGDVTKNALYEQGLLPFDDWVI